MRFSAARLLVMLALLLLPSCLPWDSASSAQPTECEQLIEQAQRAEGTPYVWGAESLAGGMDCSGFVYWIQRQVGDPVPRTTARKYWIYAKGDKAHWSEAKCGFWVWWTFSEGRPHGHIGIHARDRRFWQSGSSAGVYSRRFFQGSFWDKHFDGSKHR